MNGTHDKKMEIECVAWKKKKKSFRRLPESNRSDWLEGSEDGEKRGENEVNTKKRWRQKGWWIDGEVRRDQSKNLKEIMLETSMRNEFGRKPVGHVKKFIHLDGVWLKLKFTDSKFLAHLCSFLLLFLARITRVVHLLLLRIHLLPLLVLPLRNVWLLSCSLTGANLNLNRIPWAWPRVATSLPKIRFFFLFLTPRVPNISTRHRNARFNTQNPSPLTIRAVNGFEIYADTTTRHPLKCKCCRSKEWLTFHRWPIYRINNESFEKLCKTLRQIHRGGIVGKFI